VRKFDSACEVRREWLGVSFDRAQQSRCQAKLK